MVQSAPPKNEADVANICASFQWTACEAVAQKLTRALVVLHENYPEATRVVLAGGVAANRYIYERLNRTCEDAGCILTAPPVALCTDNAAMIAWAGVERFNAGCFSDADFEPRARWPLATVAAS